MCENSKPGSCTHLSKGCTSIPAGHNNITEEESTDENLGIAIELDTVQVHISSVISGNNLVHSKLVTWTLGK